MTSEEFAKWMARPGACYSVNVADGETITLINRAYTLAKDYLALLERHKEFVMANDNLSRSADHWRERYVAENNEVLRLKKMVKEQPVEYDMEAISRELYKWLREIGLPVEVPPKAPHFAEGYVWVRYPKEPK